MISVLPLFQGFRISVSASCANHITVCEINGIPIGIHIGAGAYIALLLEVVLSAQRGGWRSFVNYRAAFCTYGAAFITRVRACRLARFYGSMGADRVRAFFPFVQDDGMTIAAS